jgi:hypothetical protein
MAGATLQMRLRPFARRMFVVGVCAGLGWGMVAAVLVLATGVWLDLLWELPPNVRVACIGGALAAIVLFLAGMSLPALRHGAPKALASRLDRTVKSGGQILSAVDLSLESGRRPPLTAGLAALAVRQAGQLAEQIRRSDAVPAKPVYLSAGGVALLGGMLALAAVAMPRLAWAEWLRFSDPYGDHPPFSRVLYHVEPGDVQVVYGAGLDIRVTTEGPPVERLDLVLENDGAAHAETLPMFREPDGEWRASLANVTTEGRYYLRCPSGRSERYQISVLTVPRLTSVRFRITPPAYTNLQPTEGPLPQGGLAGLKGTQVQITASSNRPLSAGAVDFVGQGHKESLVLKPSSSDSQEVTGTLQIRKAGKLQLQVIDTADQRSADVFVAPIALLTDERPFIRLLEPHAVSYATPDAALPVVLAAEDDYGISRVQLFRSLNDSRPLPMDVSVPAPAPIRWGDTLILPLATYGLVPGDEIKLFGRVEDNDPDGPKGSESAVVVVRIIAQEEFDRMIRVRQGMEVFLSKYRQAQRRLANLAEEGDRLRKKLKKQPADSDASKEAREELAKLAARMCEEAEALRLSAKRNLPYDLDKALSRQLERMADQVQRLSRETEALCRKAPLSAGAMAEALNQLMEQLNRERGELEREAIEPLEHMASILPLLEDANRFVILYQRQRSLADRLLSLKGIDRPDDPAIKARMRDLQAEQQELRNALAGLLEDIEDHVTRLPDDAKLEELVKSARKFVQDVRDSGAAEAMGEAESALGEFSGSRGHDSARKAADILEKFLAQCQGQGGMMGQGQTALRFKPVLSRCLGDTVEQMLAEAGLLPGSGPPPGGGQGAGGGYSAQRNSLENVGLYGNPAGLGEMPADGRSSDNRGALAGGSKRGTDRAARPQSAKADDKGSAAGATEVAVPLPYRRRVAEYFQRVADETGRK